MLFSSLHLLLTEPRWTNTEKQVSIRVVLDSSASMSAYKEELNSVWSKMEKALEFDVPIYWDVISDRSTNHKVYQGNSLSELQKATEKWSPAGNTATLPEINNSSQELEHSQYVFITDNKQYSAPQPFHTIAIGSPKSNVGFTGFNSVNSGDGSQWEIAIKNYSNQKLKRLLKIEHSVNGIQEKAISLPPYSIQTISGEFPDQENPIHFSLDKDSFSLDDTYTLYPKQQNEIPVLISGSSNFQEWVYKWASKIPEWKIIDPSNEENAFFQISEITEANLPANQSGVFFMPPSKNGERIVLPVSLEHSLMHDLSISSLLIDSYNGKYLDGFENLVIKGAKPIISNKSETRTQQLFFHFSPLESNLDRLPSLPVIIHRWFKKNSLNRIYSQMKKLSCGPITDLVQSFKFSKPNLLLHLFRQRVFRKKSAPLNISYLKFQEHLNVYKMAKFISKALTISTTFKKPI